MINSWLNTEHFCLSVSLSPPFQFLFYWVEKKTRKTIRIEIIIMGDWANINTNIFLALFCIYASMHTLCIIIIVSPLSLPHQIELIVMDSVLDRPLDQTNKKKEQHLVNVGLWYTKKQIRMINFSHFWSQLGDASSVSISVAMHVSYLYHAYDL